MFRRTAPLFLQILSLAFGLALLLTLTPTTNAANTPELFYDFGLTSWGQNSVVKISAHSQGPNLWLVLTQKGLFKSADAGQSFSLLLPYVLDFAWHPTNPQVIYISNNGRLYKSVNAGSSWQALSQPSGMVLSVLLDPRESQFLYLFVFNFQDDPNFFKIYRTENEGVSFVPIASQFTPTLYASPFSGNLYFSALFSQSGSSRLTFFKSTNHGNSWSTTYPWENGISSGEDISSIYEDSQGRIWVATSGSGLISTPPKIYLSTNQGVSWQNRSAGLTSTSASIVSDFLIDQADPNLAYAALSDVGLFKTSNAGEGWQKILDISQFIAAPQPTKIYSLFKKNSDFYFGTDMGQIFKLTQGPAAQHPVIFIHGLGGHPADWEEGGSTDIYFKTLKAPPYNYPNDFLYAYHYSDADGNPATYDNQGDVRLISKGLKGDVDRLAELYYPGCQVDCVDLVGYSLGGIVIRQYLNDHQFDHKVRKAITIASPHRGAWVLSPLDFINSIPFLGPYVREAMADTVNTLIQLFGSNLDLNSEAVKQATPASDYLKTINYLTLSTPAFTAIYGDIDIQFTQKIFFYEVVSQKINLGDPVILPESAIGIPAEKLKSYGFSDPNTLNFNLTVEEEGPLIFSYQIDILGINDLKYEHRRLVTEPDVVDFVIENLTL